MTELVEFVESPSKKNGKHGKKEKSVNSRTPPVEIWYMLVLKSATHIKHLISVNFTRRYQTRDLPNKVVTSTHTAVTLKEQHKINSDL